MSFTETLAALCVGRRPANDGLLGNARLEWAGGEAYGEEAILESFRANPLDPGQGKVLQGTAAAAWIGHDAALFADLYDGRIGRLWRLGPGSPPPGEPAVAVAFDADLQQARGGMAFRAADHPDLDAAAQEAVVAAGNALLGGEHVPPLYRIRAFVARAFSAGDDAVGLYALHRLTAETPRRAGFGYAVAQIGAGAAPLLVVDRWSPADWTPRL